MRLRSVFCVSLKNYFKKSFRNCKDKSPKNDVISSENFSTTLLFNLDIKSNLSDRLTNLHSGNTQVAWPSFYYTSLIL